MTDNGRHHAGAGEQSAGTWQTIVDDCADRLETVKHGIDNGDWEALASLAWADPVPTAAPPEEVRERLQRLLHLSRTLQRRVATEMRSVQEELSRGPQMRKANRAYIQAGAGSTSSTRPL